MEIAGARLAGVHYKPLQFSALSDEPQYIVLHNTAGGSIQGSYEHLKKNNLGYHVLVDRSGEPLQCVDFDRAASHAGRSNWHGRDSLNGFSLGVSAANYGPLSPQADGKFYNRGKNGKVVSRVLTAEQVTVARHPNGGGEFGWENYPKEQIETMLEICKALLAKYTTIIDIVGHDDIAIGRKVDPGPAFPMPLFHALLDGRNPGPRYRVNTPGDTLSLRAAPVQNAAKMKDLPDGTRLHLRSRAYTYVSSSKAVESGWASVDLDGNLDHDGFVFAKYLVLDP